MVEWIRILSFIGPRVASNGFKAKVLYNKLASVSRSLYQHTRTQHKQHKTNMAQAMLDLFYGKDAERAIYISDSEDDDVYMGNTTEDDEPSDDDIIPFPILSDDPVELDEDPEVVYSRLCAEHDEIYAKLQVNWDDSDGAEKFLLRLDELGEEKRACRIHLFGE